MKGAAAVQRWVMGGVPADPDVVRDAMRVTVWGRWFLLLVVFLLTVYRPGHEGLEFPAPHLLMHLLMNLAPLVFNGIAHYRLLTNRRVTWRWMLGLGAMDVALTTSYVASHHGFEDFAFLGYYPALGAFAVVFLLVPVHPGLGDHDGRHLHSRVRDGRSGYGYRRRRREGAGGQAGRDVPDCRGRRPHRPVGTCQEAGGDGEGAAGPPGTHRSVPGDPRHDRPDRLHDRSGHRGRHESGRRL